MTFTYIPSSSLSTPLGQIRLLIGDTDSDDQQLQDEEINYAITLENGRSTQYCAARACEFVASFYARQVRTQVGHLRVEAETKYSHYLELAEQLRRRAAITDCAPVAPALSIASKQAQEDNTDRTPPIFTRNDARNPQSRYPYPGTRTHSWPYSS